MNAHPSSPRRRERGFSLAELLLVLALIGILAALAAPSLSSYLTVSRLNAAVGEVQGDLARTRMEAVRRGRSASFRITPTSGTYTITINADDGTTVLRTVKTRNLRSDYGTLSFSSSSPAAVTFNSRGLLNASGDVVVGLVRDGRTTALSISPIGRVNRVY